MRLPVNVPLIFSVCGSVLRALPLAKFRVVSIRCRVSSSKDTQTVCGGRATVDRRVGFEVNRVFFFITCRQLFVSRGGYVKNGTTTVIRFVSIIIGEGVGVTITIRRRASGIVYVFCVSFMLNAIRGPFPDTRATFTWRRPSFDIVVEGMLYISVHRGKIVARCDDVCQDATGTFPRFGRALNAGEGDRATWYS